MEVTLQAQARPQSGKGAARKLRAQGKVPAVLYGRGIDAVPVTVDRRELNHALHTDAGRNVLIDLQIDGERHLTFPREIHRDPVRGDLVHVDFLKVARDVAMEVDVPVHVVGDSRGVKEGGVIEHHIWQVSVRCLPTDVPERLDADVTDLGVGESFRVESLPVPEGVEILTPGDEIIVSCVVPQKAEEPAVTPPEAEAAAAAEGAGPGGGEG